MLVRPAHARRVAGRAVVLAACLCALPLLVPRSASAATADDRASASAERATDGAATTRATGDADQNTTAQNATDTDASVLVGGQPAPLFRTMLSGVGAAGLVGGSAVLLAHPAAATPAVIVPTGATSVASPTPGSTATGTTNDATPSVVTGSTGQPAVAPPVPLPAVQPAIDVIVNPEPATLALFGAGALALGGLARRRARR